jgi:hypothetical protein
MITHDPHMTPEQQATFEATMAAAGSKATYTGAGASFMGWVLSSEFGVFIGLMLGVGGFCINWYYKAKEDKRQQAEHDRRMGLYE